MKCTLLTFALLVPVTVASAQKKTAAGRTVVVDAPDAITWGPAPAMLPAGSKVAVLEGDPAKAGPFTMRLQMPDGYQIAPHFHHKTEHVTVISGTVLVGLGEKFDESQMKTLPAGTFGMIPVGVRHYAKAKGETIIQLHGVGPWGLTYVNKADDPRHKKVATR